MKVVLTRRALSSVLFRFLLIRFIEPLLQFVISLCVLFFDGKLESCRAAFDLFANCLFFTRVYLMKLVYLIVHTPNTSYIL